MHLIKFPLISSNIGCILIANCYSTCQVKFQISKIAEVVNVSSICVHQKL